GSFGTSSFQGFVYTGSVLPVQRVTTVNRSAHRFKEWLLFEPFFYATPERPSCLCKLSVQLFVELIVYSQSCISLFRGCATHRCPEGVPLWPRTCKSSYWATNLTEFVRQRYYSCMGRVVCHA